VSPPQYRLRVGAWRVRVTVDREAKVLQVLHVLPRGKAYLLTDYVEQALD
jgi:mRNA-degrading endonuclease RelE of RelBE toxin-antitoxin system